MQISLPRLALILTTALTACASARDTSPTSTPLPLPTQTLAFVTSLRPTATAAPAERPARSPAPSLTPSSVPIATPTQPPAAMAASGIRATPTASVVESRAGAPAALEAALRSAGIDSSVYWFTFDTGDREQALMIQYASPIVHRPGYAEMLLTAKAVAAAHFLKIDPPLYTLIIAATDITGTSDTVLRLRRDAVQRWSDGEIDGAELLNNGFEHVRIVVTCSDAGCTAVNPTPFPTFPPFPFPFPTPTP